jgi:glycerophosphoryl diester phosphodiesterase
LAVSAWTVNAPKDMQRLRALGVEALITDRPDLLI